MDASSNNIIANYTTSSPFGLTVVKSKNTHHAKSQDTLLTTQMQLYLSFHQIRPFHLVQPSFPDAKNNKNPSTTSENNYFEQRFSSVCSDDQKSQGAQTYIMFNDLM